MLDAVSADGCGVGPACYVGYTSVTVCFPLRISLFSRLACARCSYTIHPHSLQTFRLIPAGTVADGTPEECSAVRSLQLQTVSGQGTQGSRPQVLRAPCEAKEYIKLTVYTEYSSVLRLFENSICVDLVKKTSSKPRHHMTHSGDYSHGSVRSALLTCPSERS